MHKARLERSKINFPSICVRCGVADPMRRFQLVLPYRAWWRSNPAIKSPVCSKCFIILGVQEWVSLVLMLGAALVSTFYVSTWGILFIIGTQRRLFHTVPEWLVSRSFAEIFVCTVVLGAVWLFGNFRDRFLRRDHLKVVITDYQNDWVEFAVSDKSYFEQLERQSQIFS
jgi:hypothetical protein